MLASFGFDVVAGHRVTIAHEGRGGAGRQLLARVSFDSPGVSPAPPPLGAERYPALRRAFPATWGAVSEDLASEFGQHFKTGMYVTAVARCHSVAALPIDAKRLAANGRLSPLAVHSIHWIR